MWAQPPSLYSPHVHHVKAQGTPWTQGQVCPNPGNTLITAMLDGVTGPRRVGPLPTGLTSGKELLELLQAGKRSAGKQVSWAAQLPVLEASVIQQFPHTDGSAPAGSFTFVAPSRGLERLSLTLALNLGKLGLWKYNSVRVRQTCDLGRTT